MADQAVKDYCLVYVFQTNICAVLHYSHGPWDPAREELIKRCDAWRKNSVESYWMLKNDIFDYLKGLPE